jgi:hypothetical protein
MHRLDPKSHCKSAVTISPLDWSHGGEKARRNAKPTPAINTLVNPHSINSRFVASRADYELRMAPARQGSLLFLVTRSALFAEGRHPFLHERAHA